MAAGLAVLGAQAASALDYAPTFNASMLGGQYFFQSANANLNVNGTVNAAAAVKANDTWSVMPMFVGNYQGTKGTSDAVPAGSLFQQEMDYRGSVTGIYQTEGSPWKIKPTASYKYEFLRQTANETWGNGLFDYEKIGTGLEAENVYKDPFSYRLGVDVFRIRFPNYQSLESKAPLDPLGNPLARAVFNQNVLDTYNFQASGAGALPYPLENPVVSLSGGYSFLYQYYMDQNLINQKDEVTSGQRNDVLQTLNLGVGYPRAVRFFGGEQRLEARFGLNLSYNGSNQSFFDVTTQQYFADAYSYLSYGFGPSASLSWGDQKRPTTVGTSLSWTRLAYLNRQSQNGAGIYTGSGLRQDLYAWGINFSYPISQAFYLKAQTNFLWARSNNTFETAYAYNYRTANYLMGFSFEY